MILISRQNNNQQLIDQSELLTSLDSNAFETKTKTKTKRYLCESERQVTSKQIFTLMIKCEEVIKTLFLFSNLQILSHKYE